MSIRWSITGLSMLALAVPNIPNFAIGVLAPYIVTDIGLSTMQLGVLTASLFASATLLSPLAGRMVDRWGGRILLLVLLVTGVFVPMAMAAAPTYWLLLVAVMTGGLGLALSNPVTNIMLLTSVAGWRWERLAVGLKQSGVQVAAVLCGLILPSLAITLGWRAALGMTATASALGVILSWMVPKQPAKRAYPVLPPPEWIRMLRIYAILLGMGTACVTVYLPLYIVDSFGRSPQLGGALAALTGAAGLVGRLFWPYLAGTLERSMSILVALAGTSALAAVLIATAQHLGFVWVVVGAVLFGGTCNSWMSLGMLVLIRHVPAGQGGRVAGRIMAGFYMGFVLGPPAFGAVVDAMNSFVPAWVGVGLMALAGAVILARTRKTHTSVRVES